MATGGNKDLYYTILYNRLNVKLRRVHCTAPPPISAEFLYFRVSMSRMFTEALDYDNPAMHNSAENRGSCDVEL